MDMRDKQAPIKLMLFLFVLLLIASLLGAFHQTRTEPSQKVTDLYQLSEMRLLENIHNLSGLAYHPPSDKLYAISNNPERIYILNKQGYVEREITLEGFQDTESIDYMYDDFFVIAEERRRVLAIIELHPDTEHVDYAAAEKISVGDPDGDNKGLEGVVFSETSGLFVVQEAPARFIHQAYPLTEAYQPTFQALKRTQLNVKDLSGLSKLHSQPGRLLALSDESHSLHIIDLNGVELSRIRLRKGWFNLRPVMQQPEGVTTDLEGNIYLVGEPNQFLVLTPLAQ